MFLQVFCSIALTTILLSPICAEAREPADEERPIEISNIQGEHVVGLLAQSCTDEGWNAFSAWAKTSGILTRSFTDPVSVSTTKNGVKIPGQQIESSFENHKVLLTVAGRKFKGDDACLAFMDYVNSEKPAPAAWMSIIVPQARAQEAAVADSAALASGLSGTLVGMEIVNRPPYTGSGLPLIEVAFYFGTVPTKRMDRKIDMEHVMSSNFSLKCSPAAVTVQTPTHKILIRKTPSISVTAFNRESNISDVFDRDSIYAKKAFEYVTQLAKTCNNAQAADDIKRSAEDQVSSAHARYAVIGKAPDASTAGASASPGAASRGTRASGPAETTH